MAVLVVSPSSRRAWIEIPLCFAQPSPDWSPSSRRAWIEIFYDSRDGHLVEESPSSRRAWIEIVKTSGFCNGDEVALLAEGVDRNLKLVMLVAAMGVALLAEGVDRNSLFMTLWLSKPVALLAEGVDRNCTDFECMEIISHVALLAEGVDRNNTGM